MIFVTSPPFYMEMLEARGTILKSKSVKLVISRFGAAIIVTAEYTLN